jgi:folate-binding protein YgfZ
VTLQRIIALPERGVLEIRGPDAKAFLQKLVTQDLDKLSPQAAVYSAFLTTEGRYVSDFFVYEGTDGLYLDIPQTHLFEVAGQFERYKMRMQVTFHDASRALYVFAIVGEGEEWQAFNLLPLEGVCQRKGKSFMCVDPRLQALGLRVLADTQTAFPLNNIPRGTLEDYQFLRLRLGVSEAPYDLVQGKSIILEHGFHELNGISWGKGCYTGQELMARTFYRGQINKRAVPVKIEGPAPSEYTQLKKGEQVVGEMLSHCGAMGMALLRLTALEACEEENTFLTADRTRLWPYRTPWMMGREDAGG